MSADFTPTLDSYTGQSKLRFWCQKVLPLVYDDSLSYYELLNKVVEYLNNTISDVSNCEDNITALRDAFVELQDFVNEKLDDFAPEVERIIDEMIDSGEFGEILADVVNGLIANEYSTSQGYAQFDYVIKDGKLYCATASTSGAWDATKWRETTVGTDMQLLNQRVFNLNAGQVAFNESATYDNNTVGKKLKDSINDITSLNNQLAYINSGSFYDIVKTGIYYCGSRMTDKPANNTRGVYYLSAPFNNNSVMLGFYIADTTPRQIFVIKSADDTFTITPLVEEKSIADSLSYKSGDTISNYFVQTTGRFVNARNAIYCTIPLEKKISVNANNITINHTAGKQQNLYGTTPEIFQAITDAGYSTSNIIDTETPITVQRIDKNSITVAVPLKAALNVNLSTTGYTALCELFVDISFS